MFDSLIPDTAAFLIPQSLELVKHPRVCRFRFTLCRLPVKAPAGWLSFHQNLINNNQKSRCTDAGEV